MTTREPLEKSTRECARLWTEQREREAAERTRQHSMIPIRVLGDRVLVLLPPSEQAQEATTGFSYRPKDTTASGLILAQPTQSYDEEAQTRGIVAMVGEKNRMVDLADVRDALDELFANIHDNRFPDEVDRDAIERALVTLEPAPFDVKVGDCVLFSASDGERVDYDGQRYVILREADLLGIVEPVPVC